MRLPAILAACLSAAISFAQTVNINYLNPAAFSVCENGNFEVTVSNTLTETIQNVKLAADLPGGLNYLPGSVANASQSNIANLNAPVFSLPNLPPGTIHTFTFQAAATCQLIAAINSGQLFENVYTVNYTGGNKTVTTTPYLIETALLQIFSLDSPTLEGTQGDVLTRTWKLTNTRLGSLSQLVFSDTFTAGILVTTTQGIPLANSPGYFSIQLTGSDFANFGDGDGLFELDETIEIIESIEVVDCGANISQAASTLRASWGCGGDTCQVVDQNAVVNILPTNLNPNLVFSVQPGVPSDFCAGAPVSQILKITNTGTLPANNVELSILQLFPATSGMDGASLTVEIGGAPAAVTPLFSNPIFFSACAEPGQLFERADLTLPGIPAGASATVSWDAYVCAVQCASPSPTWKYYFSYEKNCPAGLSVVDSGSTAGVQVPVLLRQFVSYYIGELLADGGAYNLHYSLKSPFLVDSIGRLKVEFNLPCGLSWGDNAGFQLAGQAPDSVFVVAPAAGTPAKITMFFDLPFGVDSVGSAFQVVFHCLEDCLDLPPCIGKKVTSCPAVTSGGHGIICTGGTCNSDASGLIDEVPVNVSSTILLDSSQCGPQSCEDFGLWYDCTSAVDDICYDTVLGYFLLPPFDFHRKNLGSADNDNNRLPDPGGSIQPDLIRQDRAITGDTLETIVKGKMVVEVPGAGLPEALFSLDFSSHSKDVGWDGGLMLDTVQNKLLLTHEGIVNLGGKVTIHDAGTGQVFKCNLPQPGFLDTVKTTLQVVNTRPAHVLDRWWQLNYNYDISPALLAAEGCPIPAGWLFEDGDSVEIKVQHRVMYNALKNNSPYTINLRTSASLFAKNSPGPLQTDWYSCFGWERQWQLSGYKYLITPGSYDLPPCAASDSPDNTFFHLFLSQGNFFPYEFRHLAHLETWRYETPPGLTLLKTDLIFLQLQGGANLLTNLSVTSTFTGDGYELQLANLQNPKTDEGFSLWLRHKWELDCSIASLKVPFTATAWLAPSLPEESPTTLEFEGGGFIKPLRPNLLLSPEWTHFVGLTDEAAWEFELKNAAPGNVPPAANTWISVSSATGLLDNFELENLATGQIFQLTGGLFQLGELPPGALENFRLSAKNHNCQPDTVTLQFGWNCDPLTQIGSESCWRDTLILTVEPQLGELEMDIESPISPFELCDTIGWHTIEIFNAKLGAVYDLRLEALLPPGLFILPGSCEIAYPTGSVFQPVSDPVDLGNGLKQWNLSQLVAALGTQGLPGFNQPPNHSVSLRFRSATECGFISGKQIIFTCKATQLCDIPTNILSKPGEPLQVEGVADLYSTAVSVETNSSGTLTCGENLELEILLESDGATAGTDSVFVILPAGLGYVSNSYQPLQNASPGEPFAVFANGKMHLKWALLAGVQPGEPIRFKLSLTPLPGSGCDTSSIKIVAFQTQEAVCLATGALCTVLAETGSAEVEVEVALPQLSLSNLQITASGGTAAFSFLLENQGVDANSPVVVDFHQDLDGSGSLTPGDLFLHSQTHSGGVPGGGNVGVTGSFNASYEQLCSIIAVLDSEKNCTCAGDVETIGGSILNLLPPVSGCYLEGLEIGIAAQPGHTYQWQAPDLLECPTCATSTFQTWELNLSPNSLATVNLSLFDNNQAGCLIENQLVVNAGGGSLVGDNQISVCKNVPITLSGEPGISWQWLANGIPNGNQQTQVFSLDEFTIVQVNSVDSFGCVSSVNYEVSVFEPFELETVPLCPGSSVVVDSVEYFAPAQVCDTIIDQFGCERVHCTQILQVDSPQVDFPTAPIFTPENQEVTLNFLPETFAAYAWSPANLLSCATCPAPVAPPLDTTYLVTVTDENGCSTSGSAEVLVVPKCSVSSVALPNIFTPNGDGVNDVFRLALQEGVENVIVGSHLRIYDRWGELIFEGDAAAGWDGRRNGREMASDVFVWILEVECVDEKMNRKGDVTLVR